MQQELRIAKGWKIFVSVFLVGLLLLAAWLVYRLFDGQVHTTSNIVMSVLGSLAIIGIVVVGLLDMMKGKVIISDDKIASIGVWGTKELYFNDIQGYKFIKDYTVIVPKEESMGTIKVSNYYSPQLVLIEALESKTKNLDLEQYDAEEEELLDDDDFGETKDEREINLANTKKLTSVLNTIAGVVGGLFIIRPNLWNKSYEELTVLCIVLPFVGLYFIYKKRGLIRIFNDDNKSPYPSLQITLTIPSIGLMLRALLDYSLFDYSNVWMPTIVITALVVLIVVRADKKELQVSSGKGMWLSYLFIGLSTIAIVGFGIITVNCTFDYSVPKIFPTRVLDKSISSGKHTTYYLKLDTWGPKKTAENVSVSHSLYDNVNIKDSVNVYFRKGVFDISWFDVDK